MWFRLVPRFVGSIGTDVSALARSTGAGCNVGGVGGDGYGSGEGVVVGGPTEGGAMAYMALEASLAVAWRRKRRAPILAFF